MHDAIRAMIEKRRPKGQVDWDRALREVLQEAALAGLWRTGFFDRAAFYGGTALRLFNGLDRFSEDLDFMLLEPFPSRPASRGDVGGGVDQRGCTENRVGGFEVTSSALDDDIGGRAMAPSSRQLLDCMLSVT